MNSVMAKCSSSLILLLLYVVGGGWTFDFLHHFPSFAEIEDYLHQVAGNHTDSVRLTEEGRTLEGRPIYLVRIGTHPASSPAIFIDAGIHAREWIAPTTALFLIDKITTTPDADPRVANLTYYIMPMLNPDGYEFSRTPGNRMWRKNRAPPPPGSNCYGVDLNRNYDVIGFGIGASHNPCDDNYLGEKAGDQVEVKAASEVVMKHRDNIVVSLSLHSYGQKWLTSWGYTSQPTEDQDLLFSLGKAATQAMREATGRQYEVETAAGLYPAGGASDDFAKAVASVPYAVTIELPPDKKSFNDGFQISASSIKSVGEEVWAGLRPVALTALHEDDEASFRLGDYK